MPGRHLPPDPSKGDENTIGGYMAVHSRPAAFEGSDGMSYSVEIAVDDTGERGDRRYGGYFLFLRWRRMGEQGVEGHIETDYLAYAGSEDDARAAVGAMRLRDVKRILDERIGERAGGTPQRRWWDVMKEGGE